MLIRPRHLTAYTAPNKYRHSNSTASWAQNIRQQTDTYVHIYTHRHNLAIVHFLNAKLQKLQKLQKRKAAKAHRGNGFAYRAFRPYCYFRLTWAVSFPIFSTSWSSAQDSFCVIVQIHAECIEKLMFAESAMNDDGKIGCKYPSCRCLRQTYFIEQEFTRRYSRYVSSV